MNLNTLKEFRHEIYVCFTYARDALFNLADALMTESQAQFVLELTLLPSFERKWSSLYEALQMGRVNQTRFEQTCGTRLVTKLVKDWCWRWMLQISSDPIATLLQTGVGFTSTICSIVISR